MNLLRPFLTVVLSLGALAPCGADPAPVVHYVGGEKLSDVALIDRAGHEIDMAAYELRDWTIIQALMRASDRGVKVRIYLDGAQPAGRESTKAFDDLANKSGVEMRIKHDRSTLMHLNSYLIDGRLLRTDDLTVIESAEAAAAFKQAFDDQFAAGEVLGAPP
ncbi:MAG TPA: phospholipase D-like domain-containing protein [Methylocella sp.]|nr:phospholipase D-like domain-containing protein [Methylocella sp.]